MSRSTWQLQTQRFLMPKDGASLAECEDAIALNAQAWRYAIADGATEAFDSRAWAQQLADGWARERAPLLSAREFQQWVAEQGDRWQAGWSKRQLPWYAEEKASRGSFAAIIGLQFSESNEGLYWHAVALGDACLVRRRHDAICGAMPLSDAHCFTSSPPLVSSLHSMQQSILETLVTDQGQVASEEVFWLFSDAVAAWYLQRFAERDPVVSKFEALLASSSEDSLVHLLNEEKYAGKLRDDDIAVVRVAPQQR